MTNIKDDQLIDDLDTSLLDEQISNDPFFTTTPEFEVSYSTNIVEKLIHLTRFGNLLTLVVGNNGSGKTTLLNKFLSSIDDDFQVCHIQAQPLLSVELLFQQLTESFAGEQPPFEIPLTALQYEEWSERISIDSGNRLLIIDDTEVLSTDILNELCQLSAIQQDKETPHLHLVLFGNYDLNALLETAAKDVLSEDGLYVIDIPSLNDDESVQWITFLLETAGIDFLPNKDVLDDILADGQGNLIQLNEKAEEFIIDNQQLNTFEDEPESGRISIVGYWFAILSIFILLILGAFFFQDEISELIGLSEDKQEVIQLDSQPVLNVSPEENDVATFTDVVEERPIDERPYQQPDNNVIEGEIIEEATSSDENVSDIEIAATEPDEDSKQMSIVDESVIEPVIVPETDVPVQEISEVYPITEDEEFLMSEPDTNHVVQLIGLSEETSVQSFVAKYQALNARYYRSTLNGKPWFIIVHGSFSSRAEANSARKKLPVGLQNNGPWIKQIDVIKSEITVAQELAKE